MKYLLTVMTCKGRESALDRTLESLSLTDWPDPPLVFHDIDRFPCPKLSQVATAHRLLVTSLAQPWEYLVFCEDDVTFNVHLHHNLQHWPPTKYGLALVGSLYQSKPWATGGPHYGLAPCRQVGGSQATVIRRDVVFDLVGRWDSLKKEGLQDLRIYRGWEHVFPWVFVHQPNLVQHRPEPSTWGGPEHTSPTYSATWAA